LRGAYLNIPMDNLIELISNLVRDYGVEITASIATYTAAIRRFNIFIQHTQIHYDNSPHLRHIFRDIYDGLRPRMPSENPEYVINDIANFIHSLDNVYRLHQTNLYASFINLFEVSQNTPFQHLISNLDVNNIRLLYNTMRPFMFNLHDAFVRIYSIVPYLDHISTRIDFSTTAISTTVMILYYIGRSA
jgi:hypothetical protein